MGGYAKLYSDIVTSSIWNCDDRTRLVWITMLAMADANGYVKTSQGSLAVMSRVPAEDCKKAIDILESPDDDSRTKDRDGRRIEKVDGGWFIINYRNHRDRVSESPQAAAARERAKRFRENQKRTEKIEEYTGDGASPLSERCGKYAEMVETVLNTRPEFESMIPEDIAMEIAKVADSGTPWQRSLEEFCRDMANATEVPKNPLSLLRKYLANTKTQRTVTGGFSGSL